jgi:collagenase-like PrtC family protease
MKPSEIASGKLGGGAGLQDAACRRDVDDAVTIGVDAIIVADSFCILVD